METKNIMIVGVGGQGTLLTSRILGGITRAAGYDVKPADDELEIYPNLPKYQCVNKLLRKLNGESRGSIASEIIGELKKPYFYSVFVLNGTEVPFHELKKEELDNTYRYDALRKSLSGF